LAVRINKLELKFSNMSIFKISEVDCVAFGFMALSKYAPVTTDNLADKFPNIADYVERIKAQLYPDWNDLLKKK